MTLARIDYPEVQTLWQTPRGNSARFIVRSGTNDWNTTNSIMGDLDEYDLRAYHLKGLALDVGSYTGAWSVAAALDNPELRIIAIEAIDENADLTRRNVELNGLSDRVEVVHTAAAAPGIETADVFWRAQGNESVEHHAFVGNSTLVYSHGDINHETATVACTDLSAYASEDQPVSFMKIDCEGCEWGFLSSPAIEFVDRIVGEWHPVLGKTQADLVALLEPTHDVMVMDPEAGPALFVAVRRA